MAISDLSEEQFKTYAIESKNWKEFMIRCGYTNLGSKQYIKRKIELFEIDISHFTNIRRTKKYTDEELFKENSEYSNMVGIKKRLIKKFGWKYECSNCKLSEWMNQPIPIEIDHINGTHTDNIIENLRFLCPNCHALTDTYKGKNIKNKGVKIQYKCIDCANTVYDSNSRCIKCNSIKRRVVERPEYNQLIEDSKSMSREKIANKYGVSRTSIIRWFKYYENQI
jgi:Zn finger protein HypA/HybF involved in hydrogenase expression